MILVVDDQIEIGLSSQRYLAASGYASRYANSGIEALRQMRDRRPAIVLLDFTMPDLDGIEVLRTMRADPVLRNIPVIVFSGQGDEVRQLAMDAGADH